MCAAITPWIHELKVGGHATIYGRKHLSTSWKEVTLEQKGLVVFLANIYR